MGDPVEDIIAGLLEERARLIDTDEPGTASARRLARATDRAVSALAEAAFAPLSATWAVVALGAYGASRLLPRSDIDLLILSDASSSALKPCVEGLLYPLWDAGLEVGHQVRSRADHLRQTSQDLEILTASLTGRPVAGDITFGADLITDVARKISRRKRQTFRQLADRPREGSAFLLEPDLKEGMGGQRDIDELVWRAAVVSASPAHEVGPLVEAGVLTADEAACVAAAQETVTAARWRVQRTTGRKTSRLTLDIADQVIRDDVHAALASIAAILDTARYGRDAASGPWSPDRLIRALESGERALPEIERAAAAGLIDDVVPGLAGFMCLRRPGLGHRYTVGAHMVRTAALVADVGADDPVAAQVLRSASDTRPLLAAALAHDAGKEVPGPGHAERSTPVAAHVAAALGLDEHGAHVAETLVRQHLLLAETAATSDPEDDDVILDVAGRVGNVETLGLLYVLTAVDSLATGPGSWTRWHAALVGELLSAVDTALTEPDADTIADRAQLVRLEALDLLPSGSNLAPIIRAMHYRYLVSHSPAEVVADARLVSAVRERSAGIDADFRVGAGPVPDSYRVTVAVPDRHGIFATIAGCLTLAGLDIMDAEAHAAGRIVLDSFVVTSATNAAVEPHVWSRFERNLRAALNGNLALETRLDERRSHYSSAERHDRITVECDTGSPRTTSVCVKAPDRVGLLHDISTEIARAGLTIVRARALVQNGMAVDTFIVTDGDGEPPRDPGLLGHLSMGIRERCT